jgi:hypothetical protein
VRLVLPSLATALSTEVTREVAVAPQYALYNVSAAPRDDT